MRRRDAGPSPTRSSSSSVCGNRLILEPRVKRKHLARSQCWVEGYVLRQIPKPAPCRKLTCCRILAEHADSSRRKDGQGPASISKASSCRHRCGRRARRVSPGLRSKETSRTASMWPYRFVRLLIAIVGVMETRLRKAFEVASLADGYRRRPLEGWPETGSAPSG